MNIDDTALKHGIAPDDIQQAASWPLWVEDLDDDSPTRPLRLAFDTHSGNQPVIHAMKARPQTLDLRP